jgi:hypothetical protein
MRLIPSFKRATWKLMSSPTFFPLRRKYESSWASWTGWIASTHLISTITRFHQQVDSISQVEFFVLVDHRQAYLRFHHQTSLPQFLGQTSLIGALQQTRPKQRMNSHSGINHDAGYLIDAGHEDDCGTGHWLLLVRSLQPRTVSSVIADCLLGDEYVKVLTTGSTEEHRETRGKPTFPVFPCVPLCPPW